VGGLHLDGIKRGDHVEVVIFNTYLIKNLAHKLSSSC
jgi:hypothetical protein